MSNLELTVLDYLKSGFNLSRLERLFDRRIIRYYSKQDSKLIAVSLK